MKKNLSKKNLKEKIRENKTRRRNIEYDKRLIDLIIRHSTIVLEKMNAI